MCRSGPDFLDRVLIPGGCLASANGLILSKSMAYLVFVGQKFLDRVLIEAPGAAPESEKPR
jgi:hypothetical protein